jgi:hypothetical protein
MSRIPHCLDNRLTDGGKVVRPWRPMGLRDVEDPTVSRQSAGQHSLTSVE